ncbi:hypothetical protein V6N13_043791 [Hibiscus sabdariffa]|uniref:Uncharacterized protein n=1 Tax=Hibiscus sabdariffa TaxID=183260 RepID=A0ABR2RGK0_9ROSI
MVAIRDHLHRELSFLCSSLASSYFVAVRFPYSVVVSSVCHRGENLAPRLRRLLERQLTSNLYTELQEEAPDHARLCNSYLEQGFRTVVGVSSD